MNKLYSIIKIGYNFTAHKSKILAIILSFIANFNSNANHLILNDNWNQKQYNKLQTVLQRMNNAKKLHVAIQNDKTKRNYDVIHYDISLNWYSILSSTNSLVPSDKYWDGTVIMTLQATNDAITYIPIDASGLEIRAVYVNNTLIQPKINCSTIVLQLPAPLAIGNQAKIKIDYRYNKFEQIGFYLHHQDTKKSVLENIAYTFNSPELARFWLPCNDTPSDKATLNLRVTVPEGYTATANGKLDSTVTKSAKDDAYSATTFYWSDKNPIATYLINVVASVFDKYTEKFTPNPSVASADSLEINYFAWKNDLQQTKQKLRKTAAVLEFFANIFSPYAFDKFAWTEVYPFPYAGMENQTNVNINRTKIMFGDMSDPNLIAHEVSHHWFGNLVSTNDWNDIWFKEGAAVWSEALWAAASETSQTVADNHYFATMQAYAKQYKLYAGTYNIPLYGCSPAVFFDIPAVFVIYNKAGWLFHQLNCLLGQNAHLKVLRKLLTDYAYQSISADNFIAIYKQELAYENIGFDIETYFKQWLFGAGHPKYNLQICRIKSEHVANKTIYKEVKIILSQEQTGNNVATVFEQPIWLVFHNNGALVHTEKVLNNARVQEYAFYNVPDFTHCSVDTLRTLCDNKQMITSIESEAGRNNFLIYPNPAVSQNCVYIALNDEINMQNFDINANEVVIADMFGNEKKVKIKNLSKHVEIDISGLVPGIYGIHFCGKVTKLVVVR